MKEKNMKNDSTEKEESFSINNFIKACVSKWKWFAISILLFTFLAVAYVVTRQPSYLRTMSVLIQDQSGNSGGVSSIASQFSSLGLVSTNTSVYNELISMTSPAVMDDVVKRLHLQTNYLLKGFPHGTTLYGTNLPFTVEMLDVAENDGASFRAEVNPNGSMRLYKFRKYSGNTLEKYDREISVNSGNKIVNTPIGRVQFAANPKFTGQPYEESVVIEIRRIGFRIAVENYTAKLKGGLADQDAEVIDLSFTDVSEERADDILNTVLQVYTEKWIGDKNRISVATAGFIEDRIRLIEKELAAVEGELTRFQSEKRLPNPWESWKISIESNEVLDKEILTLSSQVSMAKYISDYVSNPANKDKVIPVNTGGLSNQLEAQIANYNSLMITRNNLRENTSSVNPIVKDYDSQLNGMREAITKALTTHTVTLSDALGRMEGKRSEMEAKLSDAPKTSEYLTVLNRQKNVKQELYMFLLQKKEETDLSQTFTADNTRIITPPHGSVEPVAPKTKVIVAMAFLFGLFLPGAVIFIRESSNTKVRSRKDLEHMRTPFIGEIPFVGKKRGKLTAILSTFSNKKTHKLETINLAVKRGSRDLINESFRIVRGNLDFMTRNDGPMAVMVTSFNPGSGKSFVTYNLALSFAIKGKKVLLIDCDLRHGSASQYIGMPSKGISSYLTGSVKNWRSLVYTLPEEPDMSVLPIGHRPPNPAELLDSELMRDLIKQAKAEYDIVFLDCPPVDIVVDTQVVSPMVDRTVFIVRAGLLEKSAVEEIDEIYESFRFKQMCLLLNGTEKEFSRYGSDGRGYYGSAYAVKE